MRSLDIAHAYASAVHSSGAAIAVAAFVASTLYQMCN